MDTIYQVIIIIILSSMVIGAFLFSSYLRLEDYLKETNKTYLDLIRPIAWPATGTVCFFGPIAYMMLTF